MRKEVFTRKILKDRKMKIERDGQKTGDPERDSTIWRDRDKLMKTEICYERAHRGRWNHSRREKGVEKQR